jgi:N-acetylneuraminate lyase
MHADGSLYLERIDRLIEHYVRNRADGLFICGTAGEGASLTLDERMRTAERWCSAARDAKLPVAVNITHTCLADCQSLAAHAEKIGAAAIGLMAPYYFKPARIEELVAFCGKVAAAAPGTPFYYYHYPKMTGVSFAIADVFAIAMGRIPTLAGFKCSAENLIDVANTLDLSTESQPINGLFGFEAMMLAALSMGVRDFIGGSFNFSLSLCRRIREAFDQGDLKTARAHQARVRAIITPMRRFDFPAAAKAVMRIIGLDCGPARLPMRNLNETECAELRKTLEKAGFFENDR